MKKAGVTSIPGYLQRRTRPGWRKVTQAVHAKGLRIFAQLWHVGRMSHVSLFSQPHSAGFSGHRSGGQYHRFALTESGERARLCRQPRALETHEVKRITADFRAPARPAMEAGFDGGNHGCKRIHL